MIHTVRDLQLPQARARVRDWYVIGRGRHARACAKRFQLFAEHGGIISLSSRCMHYTRTQGSPLHR